MKFQLANAENIKKTCSVERIVLGSLDITGWPVHETVYKMTDNESPQRREKFLLEGSENGGK